MIVHGLSFRIPQQMPLFLAAILKGIDVGSYQWKVFTNQSEVYPLGEDGGVINGTVYTEEAYEGEAFLDQIMKPQFVLFLKTGAFQHDADLKEINTFSEFYQCGCELLVLLNDCEYVEVYTKNAKHLNIILANCVINRFEDIELITEEDRRTDNMNVKQV